LVGVFVNDVMIGVAFSFFDDVVGDPMSRFPGSKFYWILGYCTSL